MSKENPFAEFPDVNDKLSAPAKKSAFERKKADDEAKRAREARENEQALADFVKSFGDEDEDSSGHGGYDNAAASGAFGSGPPRRHFIPSQGKSRLSGPGSLDPLPAPTSARKRGHDGNATIGRLQSGHSVADEGREALAEEKAAPKPTVQLQNLPPRTTEKAIRSLFKKSIQIHKVSILPPTAPGSKERRSMSAIVMFTETTPSKDIDKAVQELHNKYLGVGFNLSIARYLSSAALSSSLGPTPLTTTTSQPFGATKVQTKVAPSQRLSRAPPPQSYGEPAPRFGGRQSGLDRDRDQPPTHEELQVVVTPPSDITQLRQIHRTIEGVLTHGEAFEALLMSNPAIQQDESWSWLFSARSSSGVYYRWKLWDLVSGSFANDARPKHTFFKDAETEEPFDDGLKWAKPQSKLDYEFTNTFEDLTLVSDYSTDSGESDDGDDDVKPVGHSEDGGLLNPMDRAKLMYFLSSLPTSTSRLTKGDIAAITWFVVDHADRGAVEVVDLIIANIETPFAVDTDTSTKHQEDGDDVNRDEQADKADPSSSKLVALYVLSDILFATSTSGIRGAWRYRSLIESALLSRHTFAKLGRMERDLGWGKMRAEKWKRAVEGVLSLWEGQSCFGSETQKSLREGFENPPLTAEERIAAELEEQRKSDAQAKGKIAVAQANAPGEAGTVDQVSAPSVGLDNNVAEDVTADWDMTITPDLSDISDTSDEDIDGVVMPDSDDERSDDPSIVQAAPDNSMPPAAESTPAKIDDLAGARAKLAAFSARFKSVMEKSGQGVGAGQEKAPDLIAKLDAPMSDSKKENEKRAEKEDVDMFAS